MFRRSWDRIYDFQSSKRTARYFAHFVPAGVETVGKHKGASHPIPDMTGVNNRDRMVATAWSAVVPKPKHRQTGLLLMIRMPGAVWC